MTNNKWIMFRTFYSSYNHSIYILFLIKKNTKKKKYKRLFQHSSFFKETKGSSIKDLSPMGCMQSEDVISRSIIQTIVHCHPTPNM